jgi:hypothetical protein
MWRRPCNKVQLLDVLQLAPEPLEWVWRIREFEGIFFTNEPDELGARVRRVAVLQDGEVPLRHSEMVRLSREVEDIVWLDAIASDVAHSPHADVAFVDAFDSTTWSVSALAESQEACDFVSALSSAFGPPHQPNM